MNKHFINLFILVVWYLYSANVWSEEKPEDFSKRNAIKMAECSGLLFSMAEFHEEHNMPKLAEMYRKDAGSFVSTSLFFFTLLGLDQEKAVKAVKTYAQEPRTNAAADFEMAIISDEIPAPRTQKLIKECKEEYLPLAEGLYKTFKEQELK